MVSVTTIFQNHGLKSLHDSKLRVATNTNVGGGSTAFGSAGDSHQVRGEVALIISAWLINLTAIY